MNNASEITSIAEDKETQVQTSPEKPQKKNYGIAIAIGLLMIWVIVRPGVFTIRPNDACPRRVEPSSTLLGVQVFRSLHPPRVYV